MATVIPPVGAIVLAARKHVARDLIDEGATRPASAIEYEPRLRLRRKALEYFVGNGIVTKTRDDLYWIDEAKAREWRAKVRKRVAIAVGGALAAGFAIYAATR